MIEDIATYLQTVGVGTIGSTLFKGQIPTLPDNCVAVFQYAGSSPIVTHDKKVLDSLGLQIRVRNTEYSVGMTKAQEIIDLLSPKSNITIGTGFYLSVVANQNPVPLGLDEKGRHEFSVNFSILKRR
jgi:hypothetical protein